MVFAAFFFGWKAYVYLVGGSPKQVAGDLSIGISIISRFLSHPMTSPSQPVPAVATQSYSMTISKIFVTYYTRDIAPLFRIAPFILLSLAVTLFYAIVKKSKSDVSLIAGLLLFSATIPIQVVANFGFRQNLYLFIIGLICLAAMLDRIFSRFLSGTHPNLLTTAVAACFVFVQVSGGNYNLREPVPVLNSETVDYFGGYQRLATWIDENIKPNETILVDEREGDILHILTHGNRRFEFINNCRGEQWYMWPAVPCSPPYISFWIYVGKTNPDDPRDILSGISEPMLITSIRENDAKYVFVSPGIYSLYYYLKIHPAFEEVIQLHNIAMFRVRQPVQPISAYSGIHWTTCVGEGTPEYLKNLEQTAPARYEARLQNEIGPWMGLTRQDLESFQNWKGCTFPAIFPGEYTLP